MNDKIVRAELKKLGFSAGIIVVLYATIYILESRSHFLLKMLS